MTKQRLILFAAGAAFALATVSSALAHGGGGGGNAGSAGAGKSSAPTAAARATPPDCAPGFVRAHGRCTRVTGGLLPDSLLYAQGRRLALAGYYCHALPILDAVTRQDDPMVFTMRGFTLRKLGDFGGAMVQYRRALAIDPGNIDTHEYIGEGYVASGHADLARVELARVAQGCGGTACEQYADLAQAIETGRTE